MAKRQTGGTPQGKGQEQQTSQGSQSSQASQASQTRDMPSSQRPRDTVSQGEAGTASARNSGREPGSDQEIQRSVNREGGQTSGTGMQRGGGRSMGAGTGLAGRGQGQPSLLPAFMANPGLMASAFMSNPFGFAEVMSQEMDRLFETFGAGGGGAGGLASPYQGMRSGRGLASSGSQQEMQQGSQQRMQAGGRGLSQWAPQMEVRQRGNEIVICADLPGINPNDVEIEVENGVLTISGERRQNTEDQGEGFYRTERSYGSFTRSLALPEGVNEEQVNARFDHGVLEVTVPLPQQQQQRGRRIQIQSGAGQSAERQSPGQSTGQGSGQQAGAGEGQRSSG